MATIKLTNSVKVSSASSEMHGMDTSNVIAKGQNPIPIPYTCPSDLILFSKYGNIGVTIDNYEISNVNSRIPEASCTLFCKKGTIINKFEQYYSYGDNLYVFGVK